MSVATPSLQEEGKLLAQALRYAPLGRLHLIVERRGLTVCRTSAVYSPPFLQHRQDRERPDEAMPGTLLPWKLAASLLRPLTAGSTSLVGLTGRRPSDGCA